MNSRLTYVPMRTSVPDGAVIECLAWAKSAAELYMSGKPVAL